MDWALCLPSPGQSSAPGTISPEAPVRNCSREAKPKGLVLHSSLSTQQVTRSHAHHPEATPRYAFLHTQLSLLLLHQLAPQHQHTQRAGRE